mgnify:CR=1 FL=1
MDPDDLLLRIREENEALKKERIALTNALKEYVGIGFGFKNSPVRFGQFVVDSCAGLSADSNSKVSYDPFSLPQGEGEGDPPGEQNQEGGDGGRRAASER